MKSKSEVRLLQKACVMSIVVVSFLIFSRPAQAGNASGRALHFYGNTTDNTGVLQIPIATKANIGTTDFTIEWWTKIHAGDNVTINCEAGGENWKKGSVIFDRDSLGPGDLGKFGISLINGKIAFGISTPYESYTLCGVTNIDNDVWHHVAITRTLNGLISVFIDGVIDTQYQGPAGDISYRIERQTDVASDPFLIIGGPKPIEGREHNSFVGTIDEVRISNKKKYINSFLPANEPFINDASTVLLLHFDECSNNVITDSSDNFGGPINPVIVNGGDPIGPIHILSDVPFFSNTFLDLCITPTISQECPTKSKGDANCDTLIDLADYEIWRQEYTGLISSFLSDFIPDKAIALSDFEIWRREFLIQK